MIKGLESWKDIPGYEGLYQGSTLGRIRSLDRQIKNRSNDGASIRKGAIKKLIVGNYGYLILRLCKNGKASGYLVHRIIAKLFIPNPDGKPQVNHLDGDKLNNSIENLEWCTGSENVQHAYDTGLTSKVRPIKGWTKVKEKFCPKCKEVKQIIEYNMVKHPTREDKRPNSYCRLCSIKDNYERRERFKITFSSTPKTL